MSIRKKPEEAVPVLLDRLKKAKEYSLSGGIDVSKFHEIEQLLHGTKDLYPKIKGWENTVVQQLCVLEQALDDDVFKEPQMEVEINQKLDLIKHDIEELNGMVSMVDLRVSESRRTMSLQPRDEAKEDNDDHQIFSQDWSNLGMENKIFDSEAMSSLLASFDCLKSSPAKMCCLLCLSIFPENSTIKKKPIVYWWIGERLVTETKDKTAEEVGEDVFRELLNEGFIKSTVQKNKSQVSVNSFIVYPWIRRMLILAAEENRFIAFSPQGTACNGLHRLFLWQGNDLSDVEIKDDIVSVFNVNDQYLGTKLERLAKLKKVEVLQMGRWRSCETHHIELENQELFDGVGSQEHLKYLSLRGISRIETLPSSFSKLISLKILDLRACHNLEKLPRFISTLTNLTHLDVSECYFLESMPKGLKHLRNLQVLKGFVIGGKAGKNSCKISDLVELKNLRKLGIRIGEKSEANPEGQLYSLTTLSALRILAISWGVISTSLAPEDKEWFSSLPENLKKLKLCCIPLTVVPEWLKPRKCPMGLKKLYIKGGKLKSLEHKDSQKWKFESLRLKYLKNLQMDEMQIDSLFPDYQYVEKISCHGPDLILDKTG